MIIVEIIKVNSSPSFKIFAVRRVAIEAAAIFTRLFPKRIIEKKESGFFNILLIITAFFFFFFALCSKRILFIDKIEVSEEEKKALSTIKTINSNDKL